MGCGTADDESPAVAFCSWTGGEDSCLACHRAMATYDVVELVHMAVRDDARTGRDAVDDVLHARARAIGVPLVRRRVTWDDYAAAFRRTLSASDATHGVFGNVEGPDLRGWVDDCCDDLGLTPVYPLWNEDPVALFRTVLELGFEAVVVKIDPDRLAERWLGAPLDEAFLDHLHDADCHPLGEFGEYHTLVVDGPLFEHRLPVRITGSSRVPGGLVAAVELGG